IQATMSMPSRNNDNDSNNTEQSLSMVSAPGLEEAMRRKERLQRLRQRQLNPESAATVESVDTPAGIPVAPPVLPVFRNYKAETDHLAAGHLPAPDLVDVESRLGDQLKAAEPKPLLTADSDITAIAPKKPDWDLKRGAERRLAKLERRTQRAIAELLRERLKQQKDPESLVTAVNAAADQARMGSWQAAN
ncbi:hypothetical protein BOX15_Mlig008105g1, partial [Macrostomum lignano]